VVGCELGYIQLEKLREHEQVDTERLSELIKQILADGVLKRPILADRATLTILDGHHRLRALRKLGVKVVPAMLVDYSDPRIVVRRWAGEGYISKELALEAAMSGKLLPPKTTKHMVSVDGELKHVEKLQRPVNTPLSRLRRGSVEDPL